MEPLLFIGRRGRHLGILEKLPDVQVLHASHTEEAMATLEARAPELSAIVMSWKPADGLQEIERVAEAARARDLEVVALSPRQIGRKAEEVVAAGVFWVVTVPCNTFHLRRVLKAAVDTAALKQGLTKSDHECATVLGLLQQGRFHFRLPKEARILSERLGALCPEPQAIVALLELMINSIEHGNLEIDFKSKGVLLAEGTFEQEVDRRLASPEHESRYSSLDVSRDGDVLEILLTDSGPGFDWTRYQTMDDDRILDLHGRGVLLACITLDVEYLPPGNKVRIRMPLR